MLNMKEAVDSLRRAILDKQMQDLNGFVDEEDYDLAIVASIDVTLTLTTDNYGELVTYLKKEVQKIDNDPDSLVEYMLSIFVDEDEGSWLRRLQRSQK